MALVSLVAVENFAVLDLDIVEVVQLGVELVVNQTLDHAELLELQRQLLEERLQPLEEQQRLLELPPGQLREQFQLLEPPRLPIHSQLQLQEPVADQM